MTVGDEIRLAKRRLRDAMLTVEAWPDALRAVASACHARSGQLIGIDSQGEILTHCLTGVQPEEFDQITAFGLGNAFTNPRLMIGRRADILVPVADQDWVDAETRRKSAIYQEVYDRLDLSFNCQAVLVRDPELLLRASVTKTARQGPMSAEEMRVFTALAPHIQAAARVQVGLAQAFNLSALRMLDTLAAPGLLLDSRGGVIAVSEAAEAAIAAGGLLRLRDRRVETWLVEDMPAFERAVHNALAEPEAETPGAGQVWVRNRDGRCDHVLDVIPQAASGHLPGLTPAVLILARPARTLQSPAERARSAWGLSAAEAEIAASLAAGLDLNAISEARGASRTTVRSQLQTIYAKAGVRRQAELVAAVLALGHV